MDLNFKEILIDGINYMKRVSSNLDIIVEIDSKDEKQIRNQYEHLKEGLEWIRDVQIHLENLAEVDCSTIMVNKQKASNIIKKYNEYIISLEGLLNNGDYEKLQQSIKNELPKHFKKLTTVFKKINELFLNKMN